MKAILINVVNRTISEIQVDDTLEDLYKNLSVDMIESGGEFKGNTLYVDEEGLLKPNKFFSFKGVGQEGFAGNGILVGFNEETGEDTDCSVSIDEVIPLIHFL